VSARDSLVRLALGEVGKDYETHRDCSGFTAWLYRQIGIEIPEGSVAQFSVGQRVGENELLLAGDLLFWDTFGEPPGHVALYIGDGQVVHALNEKKGIVRSASTAPMGGPYMGCRRILAEPGTPSTPPEEPVPNPKPLRRRRRRRKENR
jgi:cell wall-associated NlpC family hydrolase